jgi:hypothetical protein
MSGADVERAVKDARRAARRDGGRVFAFADLRKTMVEEDDRPAEQRWRTGVHEAGHIIANVIHFGPGNVFARFAKMQGRFGISTRYGLRSLLLTRVNSGSAPPAAGTGSMIGTTRAASRGFLGPPWIMWSL